MSEPTLFTKGKLIAHDFSEAQGNLDAFKPIDYIMNWFSKRLDRTGIKDRILILQSSTGSGKSTVIPPEFYHKFFDTTGHRNICCTQPRVYTSQEIPKTIIPFHTKPSMGRKTLKMGENIGFQNGVIAKRPTRGIIFMTIGVLKQQLNIMTDTEFMEKYSIIIIDEAHERSIDTDIVLYRMKLFIERNHANKECPFLLVMSATFNPEKFADYMLSSVQGRYENIIKVQGFTFPVVETFLDYDTTNYIQAAVETTIKLHNEHIDDVMTADELRDFYKQHPDKTLVLIEDKIAQRIKDQQFRDILIFISGEGDASSIIRQLNSTKDPIFLKYPIILIKLSSVDVTGRTENYMNITKPLNKIYVQVGRNRVHPTRRVIVATNVAETGITIDTLRYVIDTGFNKSNEYNPSLRIGLLVTKPVTKSMYIQRRGRAGRKAPGFAFPLYTKEIYEKLQDDQFPNITKEDTCLDLLSLLILSADPEGLYNQKSLVELNTITTKIGGKETAQSIRKRIKEQMAQLLVKPSVVGMSDYAKQLSSSTIDIAELDLIDLPSADSLSSSLDRLYTLGAIHSNSTPTLLGVAIGKFRFVSIEAIKMILAGFAWDAPIQDLITLAAMLQVPGTIWLKDQVAPERFMTSKQTLLASCDFITILVIFSRYQKKCSDSLFGDVWVSPEDWCEEHGLNYSFLSKTVSGREDIIRSMATMGLNPYAKSADSIYIKPGLDLNTVNKIKQCIFEGFKTNIATWNSINKYYETYNGKLKFTIDKPFISGTMDLIAYGLQNPKYIIYDSINYRQDFATNRYKPSINYCTVLDGYVAIDIDMMI